MSEYIKIDTGESKIIKPLVKDTYLVINKSIDDGKNILIEGAQGTLLDIDHGTYPYVTSSNSSAGGACTGLGIGPTKIDHVLAIMKAYITRVGSGPFATELGTAKQTDNEESIIKLEKQLSEEGLITLKRKIIYKANQGDEYSQGRLLRINGYEYGTTTGRARRCGWFDAVAARYSAIINGLDAVVLTKLDVLTGLKRIRICTHYNIDGKKTTNLPTNINDLEKAKPIYEELDGWDNDLSNTTNYEELPNQLKNYLKRIETLIKVPTTIASIGPERKQTIVLRKEFLF